MSNTQVILHIVYVHGFQGDHTTFQSFPTDLHNVLQPQLPPHIELRSILYPTYKSKRPIAVAAQNFLKWLETLPPGPVILCGHSMGGLLVAEAATSPTHAASKRVIALLAFDVPFLGMHPHVVISGIASLLPNKKGDSHEHGSDPDKLQGGGLKSEREMNDHRHVDVPAPGSSTTPSPNASRASLSTPTSPTPDPPSPPSLKPPPLPPRPSSNAHPSSPSPAPPIITRTLDFVQSHSNDPLVRFITKHHSDPLGAAKRWVIESFEFGVCMFDPKGLRDRYAALDKWRGQWVAFWTETVSQEQGEGGEEAGRVAIDDGKEDSKDDGMRKEREATESLGKLLEPPESTLSADSQTSSRSPSPSPPSPPASPSPAPTLPRTKSEQKALDKATKAATKQEQKQLKAASKTAKALRKQQDKELKALRKQHNPRTPHHFVVRPFSTPASPAHRWEHVEIRGAKDEVEAHCGLFLRDVNWEYEAFVRRVGGVVRGWTEGL